MSVLIPSRNETYLNQTIQSCLDNARGDLEVVVCLEGYWPSDWKDITAKYPNLHTVHHGEPRGLRAAINSAAASAIARGADYLLKLDAHVMVDEGFDVKLCADMEPNWVVVPRRKRLDAEKWAIQDVGKPDVDYHYLSFPDDPNDFGGPGLNGKVWDERIRQRLNKPEYDIDDEMASQGSAWFIASYYFQELELMDEARYSKFWNENQEIFLKCWLSGGRGVINKKTWYAHLHKSRNYKGLDGKSGRGYNLPESWLQQGASYTKKWIWNEAWPKQTLPFKWLIEHFWPVPSWPENWEEILYATRKPRVISVGVDSDNHVSGDGQLAANFAVGGLLVLAAIYGIDGHDLDGNLDVTERVQSLVRDNSLDIIVNNSTLCPGHDPHRGKKKKLTVMYQYVGSETVTVARDEKDWLIIGQVQERELKHCVGYSGNRLQELETAELIRDREGKAIAVARELPQGGTVAEPVTTERVEKYCGYCGQLVEIIDGRYKLHAKSVDAELHEVNPRTCHGSGVAYDEVVATSVLRHLTGHGGHRVVDRVVEIGPPPRTATALNDYLIRKFSISDRRLRAPMPIELPNFHRNDLAQLFAELGFKRGAEIGVAEGVYSEVLLKANPECGLLLVDPWEGYSGNPQNKTKDRHDFAFTETVRRTGKYPNAKPTIGTSMNTVGMVAEQSLDFVYIDGNHSFDYVMQDLIEWSKRVRSGGIVSGDDYYALDEKRWGAGPVEAVQAYTKAHRIPIWFICDAPRSVDFFFVRP